MLPSADQQEILRRRTFAIISHPDAGKTTLTEKLLLYGGAIHVAGAVKSNKIRKTATSDWMEIEKQRGISVATSVMGFDYDGYHINILDTPGHQDFAEDTFRTLTAVDSAIVVIDSAKGVETQTRRLMEVCRMRKTPVMVFMNKMDREGKDPFDLMDEAEKELGIHCTPVTWANGQGLKFESVFALNKRPSELSDKLQEDLEMSCFQGCIAKQCPPFIKKIARRYLAILWEGARPIRCRTDRPPRALRRRNRCSNSFADNRNCRRGSP